VNELYTVKEAAVRMTISTRSLYRLINSGRIRVVHPTPGSTRITKREVEAYIASIDRRRVA
jgi:excisionase family DNA binding protein